MYKQYIRILIVLLVSSMICVTAYATVDPGTRKFADIQDNDTASSWYRDEVYILVSRGITDGYPDNTFRPKNNINIDEFITFTVRAMMGTKIPSGTTYWASTYIEKALEFGLIAPNEYTSFNVPINRGQMAKIIVLALAYLNEKAYPYDMYKYKQRFTDFNNIPYNLMDYMLKANSKGIIAGYPDGTFKYSNKANRAEAAVMIGRLLDKSKRKVVPSLPDTSSALLPFEKNGQWGLMSKTGEIKIQPTYDYIYEYSEGLACVQKGDSFGYIDTTGKPSLTVAYPDALRFSEGLAPVFTGAWTDGKWGYINKSGQKVIRDGYDAAYSFVDGLALVKEENGTYSKWYFINKTGTYALTENNTGFTEAYSFSEGMAAVKIGTKYGFINTSGKLNIPAQFDKAESFSEGLAATVAYGTTGFVDKAGNMVISSNYADCKNFSEGLAPV